MIKNNLKNIFKLSVIALGLFMIADFASAEQLNLSKDENGWTIFTLSSDSRIVYVSADGDDATGQVYSDADFADPFQPSGEHAFATYAAAYANTRNGYPDWILIRRGDTFEESMGTNVRSGRGTSEPFLIGAYGSTGLSPLFKTGSAPGIQALNGVSWIALSGISFYAHTRDPDSVDYTGTNGADGFDFNNGDGYLSDGVLIEGCKFRFYDNNMIGPFSGTTGVVSGAVIRRCVLTDNYLQGGHSQNLYAWGIDGLVIEECVFDHGGWYHNSAGTIGTANTLSHNLYFASVQNNTFKNNIFSRGAGANMKFTAETDVYGLNIDNNLLIDAGVQITTGANVPENIERFFSPQITNNVFTLTGFTDPCNANTAWGIMISGYAGGLFDRNIFLDSDVAERNSENFRVWRFSRDIVFSNNVSLGQVNTSAEIEFVLEVGDDLSTGLQFTNNKMELSGTDTDFIGGTTYQNISGLSFTGNTWYAPEISTFRVGETVYTTEQWLASVEPTASFSQPVYPDRTRNIQTYMESIGMTNTVDAFIAAARNQDRYNWDARYAASTVNTWIRNGFFESSDVVAPQSPSGLAVQ